MCLQCVAKSVSYGEVLPGFHLQKATQTTYEGTSMEGEWKKDQWALVECNDPSFYLTIEPIKEDAMPEDAKVDDYYTAASQIDRDICDGMEARAIYRIIEAAKTRGYNPGPTRTANNLQGSSGQFFGSWLCGYLAKYIETAKPIEETFEND